MIEVRHVINVNSWPLISSTEYVILQQTNNVT